MMKPLQASDRALADRYRTIFYHTRGIKVLPISLAVADRAAELRAKHNLRTPDALHVASAITSRCDAFLTNDAGIKRVDDIKVLILGELALRVQNGNEADNGSNM
jgi:predicted nucleic acid-binding protein